MLCISTRTIDEAEWNCSHWRAHLLSNAINWKHEQNPNKFPHAAKMFAMKSALDWHHPEVQRQLGWADVIVFQRNVIAQAIWDTQDYWRALGKIVLVDLDDGYSCIPASNPAFPHWHLNTPGLDPHPVEALEKGLKHADALISPNKAILKDWEHVVDGFYWPNYPSLLDYAGLPMKQIGSPDVSFKYPSGKEVAKLEDGERPELIAEVRKGTHGKTIIGWGGSISHVDSFMYSGVIPALARLLEERDDVLFKFCGNESRLNFLLEELPEDKLIRQDGVVPKDWPSVLPTFDIGIAPMDMRPVEGKTESEINEYSYDERRSYLKIVEYLCAGIPFVATDCLPYRELGQYGKLVKNTEEAWYEALKARVDSLQFFKKEAQDRKPWALKRYTIENNAERLIALYIKIGESAQAKEGMRLPNTAYVDPSKATELPVERRKEPTPPQYSGDPLRAGRTPWTDIVEERARNWYRGSGYTHDDIELGYAIEYSTISKMNVAFKKQAEDEQREIERRKLCTCGTENTEEPLEHPPDCGYWTKEEKEDERTEVE